MTSIIAALVSLGCVAVLLGLALKVMFGDTTVLRVGGVLLLVALLPAIAVGLFAQLTASASAGVGSGSIVSVLALVGSFAIVSAVAYLVLVAKGLVGGKRSGDEQRGTRRGGYRLDDGDSED